MINELSQFIAEYIFVPVAHADTISTLLARINYHILNPLILVLFAAAFVQFFLGVLKFFRFKEEGKDLDEAKNHILWGIIGMAIMVSVFGIMKLLTGTLGLNDISPAIKKGSGNGDVSVLFKK